MAVFPLLSQRLDSEAWTIGRSIAEILIRLKSVHKKKSNAIWMILGTELVKRNRLSSDKRP